MRNITLAVLVILMLQGLPAYAGVIIDPSVHIVITNGNITTATTQTYDTINLTSNAIIINSKTLQLTPSNNANIKINTFDTASDIYNLSLSGTGSLDFQQKVILSNQIFNFFRGGVYDFAVTSNSTGWISKTNIPLSPIPQIYTYPLPYTAPPPGGSVGENPPGNPNYIPPTPAPTASTTQTSAPAPQINLLTLTQDPIWMMILQGLLIIGMAMVAIFVFKDNIQIGTPVTGMLMIILSSWSMGWWK